MTINSPINLNGHSYPQVFVSPNKKNIKKYDSNIPYEILIENFPIQNMTTPQI